MRPRIDLACLVAIALFGASAVDAADLNICAALPIATVNKLVNQNLTGVRKDVSEEAHSYGCAYGTGGLVSVSVIRPGGAQAFTRTSSRYPKATTVAGLGDKAIYDKSMGTIALFGDTVVDAFVPRGTLSDAQTVAIEKAMILAVRAHL